MAKKRPRRDRIRKISSSSQSVTLRDVARAAGVSPMTVSNVVRGQFRSMSKDTRAKVKNAISALGYRPHRGARSLKLAHRFSIGMLVVDESPRFLADPFITELVAGLSNFLSERGYDLVLQGIRSRKLRNSTLFQNVQTDGLCVLLSGSSAERTRTLKLLRGLRQPLVLFQERSPTGASDDLCVVRQNDRKGGWMLASLLLDGGDRDLLMVVPELEWPAIMERAEGVREAIGQRKNEAFLSIIQVKDTFYEVQTAITRHLKRASVPDAILAGNDQIGFAVTKCLAARGLHVPHDVRVTGFNAFEFWRYADLALTTVRSPAYDLGVRGGAEILERLERGSFKERDIVLPVELWLGESTGAASP